MFQILSLSLITLLLAGLIVLCVRMARLQTRPVPQARPAPAPPPLPQRPKARAAIQVPTVAPSNCAVETCHRAPQAWVSLSSAYHLFLCAEHALAAETKRTRWRITDPRLLLKRISRITVARA